MGVAVAKVKRVAPLEGGTWDLSELGAVQHTSRWGTVARSKGSTLRYYPGCPWEKAPKEPPKKEPWGILVRGWRGNPRPSDPDLYAYLAVVHIWHEGSFVGTTYAIADYPVDPNRPGIYRNKGPLTWPTHFPDLEATQLHFAPDGLCAYWAAWRPPPWPPTPWPLQGSPTPFWTTDEPTDSAPVAPATYPHLQEQFWWGGVPRQYRVNIMGGEPAAPPPPDLDIMVPYTLWEDYPGEDIYIPLFLKWTTGRLWQLRVYLADPEGNPFPEEIAYARTRSFTLLCPSRYPEYVTVRISYDCPPGTYVFHILLEDMETGNAWETDAITLVVLSWEDEGG